MKKLFMFALLISLGLSQFSCSEKTTQESENQEIVSEETPETETEEVSENTEANPIGENDEKRPAPVQAQEDTDGFIQFSANGTEIKCNYIADINPKTNVFEYKEDKSFAVVLMERGSEVKMKEKIVLKLLNFDLQNMTFPAEIKKENDNQTMSIIYSVRNKTKYKNYYSDDFYMIINSFKDGVLEGNFKAKAKERDSDQEVNIENGAFKITLQESKI